MRRISKLRFTKKRKEWEDDGLTEAEMVFLEGLPSISRKKTVKGKRKKVKGGGA